MVQGALFNSVNFVYVQRQVTTTIALRTLPCQVDPTIIQQYCCDGIMREIVESKFSLSGQTEG